MSFHVQPGWVALEAINDPDTPRAYKVFHGHLVGQRVLVGGDERHWVHCQFANARIVLVPESAIALVWK